MAAEPRIYRWDDADAPVPTSRNDALYEILKPCLVDGYGAQPAAGWSVVYDDWATNSICTLTNAAQSGVLGLVKSANSSYGCGLFIADAMVDATSAVNARSGVNSVADVTALTAVSGNSIFSGYSNRWKNWVVIANENFAFVTFALSSSYFSDSYSSVSWTYFENIAFGSCKSLRGLGGVSDADVGNFVLLGAPIGSHSNIGWNNTSCISCRDDLGGVPSDVFYGHVWPWRLTSAVTYGVNAADNIVEFQLSPVEVWGGTTTTAKDSKQLAKTPMLLASCHMMSPSAYPLADYLAPERLDSAVTIAGKTCYCVNMPNSNGGFLFISMELEDWL